jgi:hypothetical protein
MGSLSLYTLNSSYLSTFINIIRLEQRAFIDDSSYLSDDSLEFVNGHKIAMDNHRYLIEKGRKEHDEERKKLLAAYDKKMELLEQRLYGGGKYLTIFCTYL